MPDEEPLQLKPQQKEPFSPTLELTPPRSLTFSKKLDLSTLGPLSLAPDAKLLPPLSPWLTLLDELFSPAAYCPFHSVEKKGAPNHSYREVLFLTDKCLPSLEVEKMNVDAKKASLPPFTKTN